MARFTLATLLLLFWSVQNATADVVITLLEETATRRAGRPQAFEWRFPAIPGAATLLIETPLGSGNVSSAEIRLNGVTVAGPRNFSERRSPTEVLVTLLKINELSVQLRGAPGDAMSIQILQRLTDTIGASVITPSGGSVTVMDPTGLLDGISLEVPPGALNESRVITISQADSGPPLPITHDSAGALFELGPDGTVFALPSTLRIPKDLLPQGSVHDLQLLSNSGTDSSWNYVHSIVEADGSLTASLSHFSIYRMVRGRYRANSHLTWSITRYPSNLSGSVAAVRDAVERAFANWEAELRDVGISFSEVSSGADIDIKWSDAPNVSNLITWTGLADIICNAGLSQFTGTITCYDSLAFKPLAGRTSPAYWVALPEAETTLRSPAEVDVEFSVSHEIGHLLGLQHLTSGPNPPMMAARASSTLATHQLTATDVFFLRQLYAVDQTSSLNVIGGTYGSASGIIGTTLTFDPVVATGLVTSLTLTGPPGWNQDALVQIGRYQPEGTAASRALWWHFSPAINGTYRVNTQVGNTRYSGSFQVDTASQLSAPSITMFSASTSRMSVTWTAVAGARSYLVRVNAVPFPGFSVREMIVPASSTTWVLDGLTLTPGETYQAVVFAMSRDVATPDPLIGQFNMSGTSRVFVPR